MTGTGRMLSWLRSAHSPSMFVFDSTHSSELLLAQWEHNGLMNLVGLISLELIPWAHLGYCNTEMFFDMITQPSVWCSCQIEYQLLNKQNYWSTHSALWCNVRRPARWQTTFNSSSSCCLENDLGSTSLKTCGTSVFAAIASGHEWAGTVRENNLFNLGEWHCNTLLVQSREAGNKCRQGFTCAAVQISSGNASLLLGIFSVSL